MDDEAISDNISYVTNNNPPPRLASLQTIFWLLHKDTGIETDTQISSDTGIHAIDRKTGGLLWKGGLGGTSPKIYEEKLYLIRLGKLYAYEHGSEISRYIFFAIFCVVLITTYHILKSRKHHEELQRNLIFSSLITVIVFSLVLTIRLMEYYFVEITDFSAISSGLDDWILYLFLPALCVISGTFSGMRIKKNFNKGVITGIIPFSLIFAISLFAHPDYFDVPYMIGAVYYLFFISLIFGVVGIIISFIIKLKEGKNW